MVRKNKNGHGINGLKHFKLRLRPIFLFKDFSCVCKGINNYSRIEITRQPRRF